MSDARHLPIEGIHRRWVEPATGRTGDVPLVLLHEGLGSISSWGPFPQALADGCGRPLLVYDRLGYGSSAPHRGPWPAEFMHHEAEVLAGLLAAEGVERAVLVGHSDGATIALLYPSCAGVDDAAVDGIVSISAHVFVEPLGVEAITELRDGYRERIADRLRRHHADADATFEAWSEVWLSDRFRPWTIDADLAAVTCPVLALQGAADGYGTVAQVERVAAAVSGPSRVELLDGVDHWPHKEATTDVIALIDGFLRAAGDGPGSS
ncbi:MAG: alpha/beta fold hydrolase [Acidimicrobiales bacterium]